jgi:hypothetical protein
MSPDQSCPTQVTRDDLVAFVLVYLNLAASFWESLERQAAPTRHPVRWPHLRDLGAGDHVLLWLIYHGHVEHYTTPSHAEVPRLARSLTLGDSSCFVLTRTGEAFLGRFLDYVLAEENLMEQARDMLWGGSPVPHYDPEERVLVWGRQVVKNFRQPATNQVCVLRAAEELGWPVWFDDPLPRGGGKRSQERLHDTIKALNRFQHSCVIHFKGDGTGTRIGWEYR